MHQKINQKEWINNTLTLIVEELSKPPLLDIPSLKDYVNQGKCYASLIEVQFTNKSYEIIVFDFEMSPGITREDYLAKAHAIVLDWGYNGWFNTDYKC